MIYWNVRAADRARVASRNAFGSWSYLKIISLGTYWWEFVAVLTATWFLMDSSNRLCPHKLIRKSRKLRSRRAFLVHSKCWSSIGATKKSLDSWNSSSRSPKVTSTNYQKRRRRHPRSWTFQILRSYLKGLILWLVDGHKSVTKMAAK